jgi:lipopolysaccharide/colanic/teichoic acid biosynthesis glycosyltransferase
MTTLSVTSYQIPALRQPRSRTHVAVRIAKRLSDVVLASIGLLALVVIFPVLALVIYLDSPGPILFKQRRAGRLQDGARGARCSFVEFEMLKFRTMCPDAEKFTGAVLATESDPRVTGVGRLLRRTRLDELPQLWNVLRGEMSLVGPRPERPELLENLALAIPFFEERMRDLKPGITGFAQVTLGYSGHPPPGTPIAAMAPLLTNPFQLEPAVGAEADDMRVKLLYDVAYAAALEHFWTFLRMELGVLLRTPLVMLRGLGR